jgi:ABC transport system ATP-binding/permease protein
MALISIQELSLGFGGPQLLEAIDLQIESGEWVGLVGRNGVGKTTLLKLINGDLTPDSGVITYPHDLRMAYLPQGVPQGLVGTVADVVRGGLPAESTPDDAWRGQLQVEQVIARMQLEADIPFDVLSAGMKRRALLARGLASSPDLLLLDEPTNHLDINAIKWLENFLMQWGGSLLFVTHDRVFLERLGRRIIELDGGRLFDWNCSYTTSLQRRDALLAAETKQNANFDKKLAREEQWIRQGIRARRTRNEGRVRALKRLREIRRERRERPANARMQLQEVRRSGKLVIEAEGASFAYGNQSVLQEFSTVIQRGDKVGIIGPNGSGKTTLLRILLGDLAPRQGFVRHGENLEVSYFDQLRTQLDENLSVMENVGQGRDTITINGKDRNLVGYLADFLFSKERIHAPINALSGGERNRLLLARLFSRPTNLLVLDEPTNDLDIETLEVMENILLEYSGTLLLVSHDRAFLNNLTTHTLVLDSNGQVSEYVGGYDDWQRQAQLEKLEKSGQGKIRPAAAQRLPHKAGNKEKRARAAQQRELSELPGRIEALEAEQQQLSASMAAPAFYQQDSADIAQAANRLKTLEEELAQAYQRWEELEQESVE